MTPSPPPPFNGPRERVRLVVVGVARLDERAHGPHEVSAPGQLHLDDVGAQLAQEPGTEWGGDPSPHIDHSEAG